MITKTILLMVKREISNIFEWLGEITLKKSHPNTISESSWEQWNSYMIHKWLSMNRDYIDIVNYVQKISPQNKKQIYTIYQELIPRKKTWSKYIKNENKNTYQELEGYVSKYYECSSSEANSYINILGKNVKYILEGMGVEEKEIKKIIKKAKL